MKFHRFIALFIASIFLLSLSHADGFYKWKDARGNIQYGDKPPPGVNAKPMRMPAITVIDNYADQWKPMNLENDPLTEDIKPQKTTAPASSYEVLKFIAPKANQAIRANDGDVSTMISVKPPLKDGHKIAFYLDGKEVSKGNSRTSNFKNLPRGEHTVSAKILDENGRVIKNSSVSFSVLRFSKLIKNNLNARPRASN